MNLIKRTCSWAEDHRDILLDLLRIYLGIGLFAKGIYFVGDKQFITDLLLVRGELQFASAAIAHYIPLAHIGGGAMIAAGLLTRVAVLFQLPVLAGAVVLLYQQEGLFTRGQNFDFTALVLFLLILLLFHGSGPLSLDEHMRRHQLKEED